MKYNKTDIDRIVKGTDDYHSLMRSIVSQDLRNRAGYTAPQLPETEKLPKRHPVHWQNSEYRNSMFPHWVNITTHWEHYDLNRAWEIWRYGQVLKYENKYIKLLIEEEVPNSAIDMFSWSIRNLPSFIKVGEDYDDGFTYINFHRGEFDRIFTSFELDTSLNHRGGMRSGMEWLLEAVFNWVVLESGTMEAIEDAISDFWIPF